jgi:two-component system phosphate regulon sensor histidine kinase PhoR
VAEPAPSTHRPPLPEQTEEPPGEATVARLRARVQRERQARRHAEAVGERATSELYDALQELRAAQADLLGRAEQERAVSELVREMRRDLDPARQVATATAGLRDLLGLDRCAVLLPGEEVPSWAAGLAARLLSLPQHVGGLWIDRLDPVGDAALIRDSGLGSVAAGPLEVEAGLVGWLVLGRAGPEPWSERDRAITLALSHDLGTALAQGRAWRQQERTVERLRELDQAKTDFVSTVSHELRTPLTSILGYGEMLEGGELGELGPAQLQAVSVVNRNAARLLGLVEDLLTLSGMDVRTPALQIGTVQLADLVVGSLQALGPVLTGRRLVVDVVPTSGVPPVKGDAALLERLVVNLVGNAVKFTPDGGSVCVTLDGDLAEVRLTVSDTGMGIAEEEQDRLFTRFFRSAEARRLQIPGTGLGLSVCKAVAETHGGRIRVASRAGSGTTVEVTLPALGPLAGR